MGTLGTGRRGRAAAPFVAGIAAFAAMVLAASAARAQAEPVRPATPAPLPAATSGAPVEPTPASVEASPDVDVTVAASLEGLVADWPALSRLRGNARVRMMSVAVAAPRGAVAVYRLVRVGSDDAHVGELDLGRLDILLWTPPGAKTAIVDVEVRGPLGHVKGRLEMEARLDLKAGRFLVGTSPVTGSLRIEALDLSVLTRAWPILALGGKVDASGTIAGPLASPRIDLSIAGREVEFRGEPIGDVEAAWAHADDDAMTVRLGAADAPLATARLKVPLTVDLRAGTVAWRDAAPQEVAIEAKGLTPDRLRPFWRAPAGADFRVDLSLSGAGTLDAFALDGTLEGQMSVKDVPSTPVRATLAVAPDRQSFSFVLGDGWLRLALATRIPLVAVRRSGAPLEPSALEGALDLALPLRAVAPFLPDALDRPEGQVAGRVDLSGTLGTPVLKGRIDSKGARATLIPMNRRLQDLVLALSFDGDRAVLEALDATSGPGAIRTKGEARWVATPPGHDPKAGLWSAWALTGEATADFVDFPLVLTDLPVSTVRGQIALKATAGPGDTTLAIVLSRGDAGFTEEKLPKARTVPSNPAVRVLDWLQRDVTGGSLLAGEGHLLLDLTLADPFRLHGEGADLSLAGRMVVDRRGPVVKVDGGLQVLEGGRFRLFDNKFAVKEGRLVLAEGRLDRLSGGDAPAAGGLADPDRPPAGLPLEPVIEVVARGKVMNTAVLVKVLGPARKPELVLASSPALPEYQILTLLIMGRADAVDDRNGEVRREAARIVDRFHNPGLKRQLFDRLGVDKVGLGFGKSVKQPIVTIGKQITRALYVETLYHHSAPPGTNQVQGHVEYRVDPQWTLDTVFGDRGEGGLGVFWTTTFGSPKPPQPPGDDWGRIVRRERGDTDGDGVEDPFDLCVERPEDREGYRDEDGCPDGGDPYMRAVEAPPGTLRMVAGAVRVQRFAAGGSVLDRPAQVALKEAATLLKDLPESRVEVVGHADPSGPDAVNVAVSLQRANAVRDRLAGGGLPAKRMTAVARGSLEPLDPSGTEEALRRNRRVDVRIFVEPVLVPVPVPAPVP